MAQVQQSRVKEVEWSTGLLDCFEDHQTCCYGFWCGPCLACTVSGRMKEPYCLPLYDYCCISSMTAFLGIPLSVPPVVYGMRAALRNRYKIKGSLLNDIRVSSCCAWCSWCQMYRELKVRNPKPSVVTVQNVVNVQHAPLMSQPVAFQHSVSSHHASVDNFGSETLSE